MSNKIVFNIDYKYIAYAFIYFNIIGLIMFFFERKKYINPFIFVNMMGLISFFLKKLLIKVTFDKSDNSISIKTFSFLYGIKTSKLPIDKISYKFSNKLVYRGIVVKDYFTLESLDPDYRFDDLSSIGWNEEKIRKIVETLNDMKG